MASKTPAFQYKDTNHILIALACIITLAFVVGYLLGKTGKVPHDSIVAPAPVEDMDQDENEGTFCTTDTMQCPDGSYVGRVGPDCQFAQCPGRE